MRIRNQIVIIKTLLLTQVKGASRNEFSSERWMKEDEKSGEQDMHCAAAATEISQQLEKFPVRIADPTNTRAAELEIKLL